MTTTEADAATPAPALPATTTVLWLLRGYLVLSWAAVLVIAIGAAHPGFDTPQAWFRGVIVAATSVLTLVLGHRAAARRPRALLRLRIAVSVIFVAIVGVIAFLPLPAWMVIEQVVCGALLLAVVLLVFRGRATPTA